MAKMFPKIFPEDSTSSGERKVFDFFDANAPADWIVLHSFRLPKHKTVVFGEADFVVLAPGHGIYVLEIKSGGVGFDGTYWTFVNREGKRNSKKRGPFQQAREAMFEIEKIIVGKLGDAFSRTNTIYGYGVIFTDESEFPAQNMTEDEPWRLCQKSERNDYCGFIKNLNKKFLEELNELGKHVPPVLTAVDATNIAAVLRPIVDCIVPLKSFIGSSEADIISLTEEQFDCLDDIELNKQIVVTGGAGTGKTLIAVEEAKRSAETCERIGFFCFNRNLADFIRTNIPSDKIEVWSLHAYMTAICRGGGDRKDTEFFAETLPRMTCDILRAEGRRFDKIIVDEFQDLCTQPYLNVFDLLLKGGLIDGRFTFYGDFARQAIYNEEASLSSLESMAFFAKKRLSVNCRNTRYIGNELINVTGYDDRRYRLRIMGEPVDYLSWTTREEQRTQLKECLHLLKSKGIKGESIVILSPYRRNNSIVNEFDKDKFLIGNYGDDPSAHLAVFSTIHGFKGLEREIVILTDIESYSDSRLMYIALSRARSKLIVLENVAAAKQRKRLLTDRR